ncbi:MAG: M28 family peptidase [Cytophagaceae bacterium]|nr:M28 family peptidase [Cytophagaceae bacterium]
MKKVLGFILLLFVTTGIQVRAQKLSKMPENKLSVKEVEAHLRFLASNEMLGRRTGEISNNIAARYIAEQFRLQGIKPIGENQDFLQPVPLEITKPIKSGSISTENDKLEWGKDFIALSGKALKAENAEVVYVGYGWVDENHNDYKNVDVKGKIVLCQFGIPDNNQPFQNITGSAKKIKFAAENGALALIQIYNLNFPFANITRNYGNERLSAKPEFSTEIPHIWVNSAFSKWISEKPLKSINLDISEVVKSTVNSYNVAGIIEGSDPKLKEEFIVISAHFDHIGTGKKYGKITENDSVFNGTRDNATGTTALIMAAKALSQQKTKRSILLLGYTGEELGMLGSRYYAEHPLIPLNKCVFNLNSDGAGYNDSTKVTIIGLDRTTAENEIIEASRASGLEAINDPVPEQNLFDRSDNVSLAAKGIPAPNYSPGLTAFDAEIGKFYHQAADNPENVSMSYMARFCKAFIYSARLIANKTETPVWKAGDKYEQASKKLYGK